MQDSAPAHRGRVLDELAGAGIELMEWPPFSPDLNPIEHVWDALGRLIAARLHPPESTQQLKQTLIEEVAAWENGRNKNHAKAEWQFTTADARIKLKRLYPAL